MDNRKLFMALSAALLFMLGITSCDKMIYDNYDDCPRGLYLNFYAQTECQEQPTYPEEVKQMNLYLFDDADVLQGIQTVENFSIAPTAEHFMPIEKQGRYSVMAWANLADPAYEVQNLTIGQTKKDQLLFRLKQDGKVGADLTDKTLWFAATPTFYLEDMKEGAPQYVKSSANLREYSNRITVTVDSIPKPEEYEIKLASSNGSYLANGRVAKADSTYYPGTTKVVADSACQAFFTTLKLESGHENTLIVTNKATGKEMFRTDLVGIILSSNYAANINLRCINDFNVRLVAHHCNCPDQSYMIVEVWINDWLVHNYDVEL